MDLMHGMVSCKCDDDVRNPQVTLVRIGHNSGSGFVEEERLSPSESGYAFQHRFVHVIVHRLASFSTVTLSDMNGNAITTENFERRGPDGGLDLVIKIDAKTAGAATVHNVQGGPMTPTLQTSFTLFQPAADGNMDVHTFADPDRHFVIRDQSIGTAIYQLASREAPKTHVRVGGPVISADVEFFVLHPWRDKDVERGLNNVITDGFVDATSRAMKSTTGKSDGLLNDDATMPLDAVEEIVKLRRFLANVKAFSKAKRSRTDLLFHHSPVP